VAGSCECGAGPCCRIGGARRIPERNSGTTKKARHGTRADTVRNERTASFINAHSCLVRLIRSYHENRCLPQDFGLCWLEGAIHVSATQDAPPIPPMNQASSIHGLKHIALTCNTCLQAYIKIQKHRYKKKSMCSRGSVCDSVFTYEHHNAQA
jgi:hypothetical protein